MKLKFIKNTVEIYNKMLAMASIKEYVPLDLKCCGNCAHYYMEYEFAEYDCDNPKNGAVALAAISSVGHDDSCDNWSFDGQSHSERVGNTGFLGGK